MRGQVPDKIMGTLSATASNVLLVMAPLAIIPIPGEVTLIRRNKKGRLNNYALTLFRLGPAVELNAGDRVLIWAMVPGPTGIIYYHTLLKGTVTRVTKNMVKINLYARYRPVVERAYLLKWPVLVYSIGLATKARANSRKGYKQ